MRATEQTQEAWIHKEGPIHYSNVALVDPSDNRPTRIRTGFLTDGTKVRISKRTGTIIPKPDTLKKKSGMNEDGPKDTPSNIALLKTFDEYSLVPSLSEYAVERMKMIYNYRRDQEERKEAERRVITEQAQSQGGASFLNAEGLIGEGNKEHTIDKELLFPKEQPELNNTETDHK